MKVTVLQDGLPPKPKLSFFDVWEKSPVHTGTLSREAGVSPGTVVAMLHGGLVPRADAKKVIEAFNIMTGNAYDLSTMWVPVFDPDERPLLDGPFRLTHYS